MDKRNKSYKQYGKGKHSEAIDVIKDQLRRKEAEIAYLRQRNDRLIKSLLKLATNQQRAIDALVEVLQDIDPSLVDSLVESQKEPKPEIKKEEVPEKQVLKAQTEKESEKDWRMITDDDIIQIIEMKKNDKNLSFTRIANYLNEGRIFNSKGGKWQSKTIQKRVERYLKKS